MRPPRAPRAAGQVPDNDDNMNLDELDDDDEGEGNLVIDASLDLSSASDGGDDTDYHPPSHVPTTTDADTTADTVILSGSTTPAATPTDTPMPSPVRPTLIRTRSHRSLSAVSDRPRSRTSSRGSGHSISRGPSPVLPPPGVLPPPDAGTTPALSREGSGLSGEHFYFDGFFGFLNKFLIML